MTTTSFPFARSPRDSFIKRFARALMPVLVTTTTLQPLAYAAPLPSQLTQKPNYVETAVDSNVLFLVDDSLSMEDIRLPVPKGINVNEGAGGSVTVRGHAQSYSAGVWTLSAPVAVSRRDDWILRSSTLNPLYYNPAINYLPWNDNGRAGAASSMFWQSPVGQELSSSAPDYIVDSTTKFRFGTTPHDMRYAGPNFSTAEEPRNFNRRLNSVGANPPTVPVYLQATRPANGGFAAPTDASGRNPDIFSSPQQLVTGAPVCSVTPSAPTLTTLPSTPRIGIAQPSTPRSSSTRPSTAIPETPRTDTPRSSQPRPTSNRPLSTRPSTTPTTAAAAVTTRGSAALQVSTRATSTRPSTTLPGTTDRVTSTRPSTAVPATTTRSTSTRPSSAVPADITRATTAITIEYRRELGVCGANTWTPWSLAFTTGTCTDPTSEGSRAAATQERRTCPAGYSPDGPAATATQCIAACPAGSTASGGVCTYSCPAGTTRSGNQCLGACPAGSSIVGDPATSTQCASNCPAGTTTTATQCVGTCPAGTNLIGTQCYSNCPGGTTLVGAAASSTQCISTCPAGTTTTATQCVGGTCPAGTDLISGQCYSACPAGTTINGAAASATQCIANCPAGTTINGGTCESCPGGFPTRSGSICYANCAGAVNPSNPAQCLSCAAGTLNAATAQCTNVCPAGSNLIGGLCYGACPAGTTTNGAAASATQCIGTCPTGAGLSENATQCLGACPAGFPGLRTATSTTCFAACAAGTSQVGTGSDAAFGTCRTNCPVGQAVVSASLCRGTCAAGTNQIGTSPVLCYGACPAGSTLDGAAASATQCLTNCAAGSTPSGSVCVSACPATHPSLIGTQCYQDCPATHPNPNPSSPTQCLASCPAGATQVGTQCQACPTGYSPFTGGTCCPSTSLTVSGCPAVLPPGVTTCVAGEYMRDFAQPAPAHYFVHLGGALDVPNNYARVEINRDRQTMTYPRAVGRVPSGPPDAFGNRTRLPGQCLADPCTWTEEAENFANWYTYYRTRLAASIAVNAETLSGLTAFNNNLDRLRLGYGSINYVSQAFDPFDPDFNPVNPPAPAVISSTWSKRTLRDIDGRTNDGALVRGVRPFGERPLIPYCELTVHGGTSKERCVTRKDAASDPRQEVFDWLFSLRATGSTPNREALDAAGLYYSRDDRRGPWIEPADPSSGVWLSTQDPRDDVSCRRNYTILITDGEWTNNASGSQPLVSDATRMSALSTAGPAFSSPSRPNYQYNPANEPQFSGGASGTGTLTDIALHWWRTDLRPETTGSDNTGLPNNLRLPLLDLTKPYNTAYWQHMVTYIVGFGIEASMDNAATRGSIIASAPYPGTGSPVTWPAVNVDSQVITDRDSNPPSDVNCGYDPIANPSGCGRINDTMRAALAGRGDFLSATDVRNLSERTRGAFEVLNDTDGSQTTITGRSGTLSSGDRLFAASFRTRIWTGTVQSYDAAEYFASLEGGPDPLPISSRFSAPDSRVVKTSTCKSGCVQDFPRNAAEVATLPPAQATALGNDGRMARWLRGDVAQESRSGTGIYRNRPPGQIMGSIVNSQPIYSKVQDASYGPNRPSGAAGDNYRAYVNNKRTTRKPRILVSSNGGMFHAFDVSGAPSDPDYMLETFAYVPRAAYPGLAAFASPGYTHRYLVDGPIVEGDWWNGTEWRTVAIGTTGAGPKGIFAIDVTGNGAQVLWDIDAADAATAPPSENLRDVGHILQPGVIGRAPDGQWYYFVGNGYESLDDKAKLLAINIATGNVRVVNTDSVGTATVGGTNGLGGVTPTYDGARNIEHIYAGDRQGRLWKFNIATWTSASIFTAENAGTPQPISAAPRILPHPRGGRMIVFGTGRVHERSDITDTSVQTVYAVWEKNPNAPTTPPPVLKSSLQPLTLVNRDTAAGERFREISGTDDISWAAGGDLGWYFDLRAGTATGERVVASPVESFGFVNVTSFEPSENSDPCKGNGQSFFYRLDIAQTFSRAPFSNTGPIASLPDTLNRNRLVASEVELGTLTALQPLLRPLTGVPPTTSSTALTSTQTADLANRNASTSTNPCLQSRAGGQSTPARAITSPLLNCPVEPLRVWRELPRGPR